MAKFCSINVAEIFNKTLALLRLAFIPWWATANLDSIICMYVGRLVSSVLSRANEPTEYIPH